MGKEKPDSTKKTEVAAIEPAATGTAGLRKAPTYNHNPFMSDIVVRTKSKRLTVATGARLIDTQTGEISDRNTDICQVIDVDRGEFIKVFSTDARIWFDLSLAGYKTLHALMFLIQQHPGTSEIYFNPSSMDGDIPEPIRANIKTIYKGLTELIDKKFLAKSKKGTGWFWTNPSLLFNGDRVRFVKEYRIREDGRQQALPFDE